jgi:polysaccharide chain length determinant protein (PEP-CTERM system associated)
MDSLQELLARYGVLAWRKRWYAVAAAWLFCLAGWVMIATLPNQFEASARVYIDADAVLTPLLRGIAVDSSLTDQLDLLQHMLLSRPNLERIIDKTDLQYSATGGIEKERLVESLSTSVKVVAQTRNIFSITFRNQNPQLAADVVQAVLASFVENKAGNNKSDIENAETFLDSQIDSYEKQLRDAEEKRAAFMKKYVDLLPGDNGVGGLEGARQQVTQLTGMLADAKARRTRIATELDKTDQVVMTEGPVGGGDPNTDLRAAEARLRDLEQVYTDQYPDVILQKRVVETLRKNTPPDISKSPLSGGRYEPNPAYEQLKLRLVDSDAEIDSLLRKITDARADFERLNGIARGAPELEAQSTNLNRDYDVLRKNYDELLARRESMRIGNAAQVRASNVKMVIIDPPVAPRVPVAPNRVLLAIAVMLGALAAGVGVVAAQVSLDQSFHNLVELRAMALPVIGSISLAVLPPSFGERLQKIAAIGGAFGALGLLFMVVLVLFARGG